MIYNKQRVDQLVYRATLILFIILFVASFSLLPIDTLIQSTKNEQSSANLALNAIIVIAICVLFIVTSSVFATFRFLEFYRRLSEIPKGYVPVHMNDFNKKEYYDYIAENTKECQMIYHESNTPREPIEHAGLSSPINDETIIPSSLVYEDVLRSMGDRVRLNTGQRMSHLLLREIMTIHGSDKAKMAQLYENLRFSNKPIRQEDFLQFLVEFVKAYQ